MSAVISHHNIDIGAGVGRALTVNVTGELFVCYESSERFSMQFDDGAKFPCAGGFSLRSPGGFKRVTLYNESATDSLNVDFYAGDTSVSYDYVRLPKTRLKATAGAINALAYQDFPGVSLGNRRKEFIFTNRHTSLEMWLVSIDDATLMAVIYPLRLVSIETDANIRVKNPNGATAIDYAVAEIFYLT